jgi:IS30 family transposase
MKSTGQRRHPSRAERSEFWRRWKAGETARVIARALGRSDGSIHGWLRKAGGFAPRLVTRSPVALTLQDREEISRGVSAGESMRVIAKRLERAPSTISREIERNGGLKHYRAAAADDAAWSRARRPQGCLLRERPMLAQLVASKLMLRWSPRQISGWLKRQFPDDAGMNVSHETIYRTLFVQARGALKRELTSFLRRRTVMRRSQNATHASERFHLRDAVCISQRPVQVEDRAVPGHWEGDLLFGGLHSHIATLVERRSRYVMLVKVAGKDSHSVVTALTQHVQTLPQHLMKTLTWDRGSEMALHTKFSIATAVQVYFCDPASPWQRGTNENTNGLLRQYFPKGQDLTDVSQAQLDEVAAELNGRPRMTLSFATPAEVLSQTVAATD